MAISFVGSATGTNSIASMPSHQAGDLLLFFAFRDGSTTAPSLASGMTNVGTAGANSCAARIGYLVASSASEVSGTWNNATSLICHVYRGVNIQNPTGVSYFSTGSSTTISYSLNAQSLTITNGTSRIAGFGGSVSTNVAIETAPSGMTNRSSVSDATDEAAGFDTNGGVSSWSAQTANIGGTSGGWIGACVELRATLDASGIAFISSATGANSIASMPSHQAGDLLLFFALRSGSTSLPTIPSGYTSITSVTRTTGGLSPQALLAAYKIAASGSETSGTWTNATHLICQVYRPTTANTTISIGNTNTRNTDPVTTSTTLPALTCANTGNGSWIAAAYSGVD